VNRSLKYLLPALLATVGFVSAAQAAELKVGVVNYARLVQESPQAKVVQDAMRAEFAPREKELQTLGTTLQARQDRLQKDAATMSEAQRNNAEKDLQAGARDFERKKAAYQDDINARSNEEMTKLQRVLIEEVQAYAKAQNFDVVLADGVIYAANNVDITGAVLTALQKRPARP
jgi:outer membrane protein